MKRIAWIAYILTAIVLSTDAYSQDPDPRISMSQQEARALVGDEFAKQAMTIDPTQALTPSEFMRDDQFSAAAADMGLTTTPEQNPLSPPQATGEGACSDPAKSGKYIFVSLSMTEQQRIQAIEYAKETNASVMVIGIEEPDTFTSYLSKWKTVFDKSQPQNLLFDPRLFRLYGITTVPSVVIVNNDQVAKATGTANVIWLQDQVKLYGYKDYGTVGESKNYSEVDLIEHFQQRFAQVDWDAATKDIGKRFWKKYKYIHLPTAENDRQYRIDPTVIRTKDLLAPDGSLLAPEGESINPLDSTILTKTYIVADGNNQDHMDWVVSQVTKNTQQGIATTLLLTRFSEGKEFESYYALKKLFGIEIYLYTPDVHRTFQIDALPAQVAQSGNQLLVSEYRPKL